MTYAPNHYLLRLDCVLTRLTKRALDAYSAGEFKKAEAHERLLLAMTRAYGEAHSAARRVGANDGARHG